MSKEENNKIVLKQSPIITHQLQQAGKSVQKRIDELELDKQIATEDNVKSMKKLRAELNNEVKDFEEQRGAIKKAVNNPYMEFEAIYKSEITDRYKSANDILKNKIDSVEDKIKESKKEALINYFNELCAAEKIDFVKYEDLKIEVNLSTTEKKYKESINDYIIKVLDDIALIKSTDFEAEIMTEYKKTLNASKAITEVKARKESEAKEKARIKAELIQNRKNYLESLGFNFVEITNAYEFNEDIYFTIEDIEDLSKEDFTAKYSESKVKIDDINLKALQAQQEAEAAKAEENAQPIIEETPKAEQPSPITSAPKQVAPAPLPSPKVEAPVEPLKTASFEVKATMTKLRLLGQFMKEQGIIYKNI